MNPIRIAATVLALCASSALAQQPAKGALTVVVKDISGAVIPGARIVVTAMRTGAHSETTTDRSGQAVLQIDQGSYDLKVRFTGFTSWEEEEVKVNAETQRTVTLNIAPSCGPIAIEAPDMPLEHQVLATEIPLIPMQQFTPPAKPLRHKMHWF
jgi:hypothetical protein